MKNEIEKKYINFNLYLLENFKKVGIDEVDVIILLLIDKVYQDYNKIIDPQTLKQFLTIPEKEIDTHLAKLIALKLITIEEAGGRMVFTLKGMKEILYDLIKKGNNPNTNDILYDIFENELGRALTSIEVSIIDEWLNCALTKEEILDGWKIAISRKNKTIKYLDGILNNKMNSRRG